MDRVRNRSGNKTMTPVHFDERASRNVTGLFPAYFVGCIVSFCIRQLMSSPT
jgi:hypothetical protein